MNAPFIAALAGLVSLSTLGHCLPEFTRPDVFFGVAVEPAFRMTDAARRILRGYRIVLWCSAAAAEVALIAYVIGSCAAQVAAHRRASIYATTHSSTIEVDLSAPKERLPGGPLAAILPLVALIGLGSWAITHIDRVPSRLPVHWGLHGPNRWWITSPRAIIGLLAMHALLCLLLTGSALAVLHWSRRVSASGKSAVSERLFRRRTVLLLLTVEYFMILPPVFSLLQAPSAFVMGWAVALLLTVLTFAINLMRAGQGGTWLTPAGSLPLGDRTADTRWIGGLIYLNQKDPALLVEKRMGVGYTLNLGNPWSWASLMAVVALVVIGPLFLMHSVSNSATGRPLQPDERGEDLKKEPASPGTQESLRRYILSLERGHPNYDEMTPQLSAAVNRQLPKIIAIINGLGEFRSLTHEGKDSSGFDVYVAAFARGRLEWHIGPLVDGKVTSRHFRQLP
jgi:uncharacterized membrane protein